MGKDKKEVPDILNQIEKYLNEEKYNELKQFIKKSKLQINLSKENKASDYIDNLISNLN